MGLVEARPAAHTASTLKTLGSFAGGRIHLRACCTSTMHGLAVLSGGRDEGTGACESVEIREERKLERRGLPEKACSWIPARWRGWGRESNGW